MKVEFVSSSEDSNVTVKYGDDKDDGFSLVVQDVHKNAEMCIHVSEQQLGILVKQIDAIRVIKNQYGKQYV